MLPARIAQYDPADLESLCLAGALAWGRLKPGVASNGTKAAETAPAEEALWELVARGYVSGDGVAGLRTLLLPESKRKTKRHRLRGSLKRTLPPRLMPTGRWSLWRKGNPSKPSLEPERIHEAIALQLLHRYGLVFRDLLVRETTVPPWWILLRVYRPLEARGEIRGGRFVSGFVGEQYALPEAVEGLRSMRRAAPDHEGVVISCTDPLNLVGILTPNPRVSPTSGMAIAYKNGLPEEIGPLGTLRARMCRSPKATQQA